MQMLLLFGFHSQLLSLPRKGATGKVGLPLFTCHLTTLASRSIQV
jgi:hypothetical protein